MKDVRARGGERGSALLLWIGGAALLLMAGLCLYRGLSRGLPFWTSTAVLLLILDVALWVGYSPSAAGKRIRQALAGTIPVPGSSAPAATLYGRPFPAKLSWNWTAAILGPLWYIVNGLWVHAAILLGLLLVSGGLLLPLIWLYAALKANEDLREFRIAHNSVY